MQVEATSVHYPAQRFWQDCRLVAVEVDDPELCELSDRLRQRGQLVAGEGEMPTTP